MRHVSGPPHVWNGNGGVVDDRSPIGTGHWIECHPKRSGDRRANREYLSSETAQVEQRFEATTVADLFRGNEVLIRLGRLFAAWSARLRRRPGRNGREV
jgi:hypothetical protein